MSGVKIVTTTRAAMSAVKSMASDMVSSCPLHKMCPGGIGMRGRGRASGNLTSGPVESPARLPAS